MNNSKNFFNKFNIFVYLAILTIFLPSCTAFSTFRAHIEKGQKIRFYQDQESIVSESEKTYIQVFAPQIFSNHDNYAVFWINFKNKSKKEIVFGPKNIEIFVNGYPFAVKDYKSIYAELVRQRKIDNFLAGLAGVVSAAASVGQSYYSGRSSDGTSYSGTYYSPSLKIQQQTEALDRAARQIDRTNRNFNRSVKSLKGILKANSIPPKQSIGGKFYCSIPFPPSNKTKNYVLVKVKVLGDEYLFRFENFVID